MTNQPALQVVQEWLERFSAALGKGDTNATLALFHEDAYWRDMLTFTWNIFTAEGKPAIQTMLKSTCPHVEPHSWRLENDHVDVSSDGIFSSWLLFETVHFHGKARLSLRDGLAHTLFTTATALQGHEERVGRSRDVGAELGIAHGSDPWCERRKRERAALGRSIHPFVLIVGGGQAGVTLAARLKRLSVPTLVVEKYPRVGDSWRRRYKSLYLHDAVWYDHFPYLPFPEHWPVFSSKDQMANWIEAYVEIMDLDYWTDCKCLSASFDESSAQWTVNVNYGNENLALQPKHLVLATGMSGIPNIPDVPGRDQFQGDSWHSSQHRDSDSFEGKRAIVVGSNNSAHDIAQELWDAGAKVTMVQRSSSAVIRTETANDLYMAPLYSEDAISKGVTHEVADLLFASTPYRLLPAIHKQATDLARKKDHEYYERLEKAGFWLDFGDDDTGHFIKYLRRGSGYYIDVGASELISSGEVGITRGQVSKFTSDGITLSNGEHLPADLVVFATGYGSMNGWAAQLISQEVADKVGKVWGLGSGTTKDPGPWEGELRNMWKPTRQNGLWFHGGNLHQCRHYSLVLALQLKARHEGISPQVYQLAPVYHK